MKKCLIAGSLCLCASAFGQYSTGFEAAEGYAATPGGTIITGQQGWYLPAVTGSVDGNVYTYASNALGFPTNPAPGGEQFAGATFTTGSVRMQHAVNYSAGGNWTLGIDFCFSYTGQPPGVNNLGSVSLQPSTTANICQTLYRFTDPNNPTTYEAVIGNAPAAGLPAGTPLNLTSPGTDWQGLIFNHWYHQTLSWDFTSNSITNTTLKDMTAGGPTFSFDPTGWYLQGGANNVEGLPQPTDVRMFVSGGVGNNGGYDNLSLTPVPEPATFAALGLGALLVLRRRRR